MNVASVSNLIDYCIMTISLRILQHVLGSNVPISSTWLAVCVDMEANIMLIVILSGADPYLVLLIDKRVYFLLTFHIGFLKIENNRVFK